MKALYSIALFVVLLFSNVAVAQFDVDGFAYRMVIADQTGVYLPNQTLNVQFTIYEAGNPTAILWQEEHNSVTDGRGLLNLLIGGGTNTGLGTAPTFATIPFDSEATALRVELDVNASGSYTIIKEDALWSVPYAYHSLTTEQMTDFLSDLDDVSIASPALDELLVWDGNVWINVSGSSTWMVGYAPNAGNTMNTDTAAFGYTQMHMNVDTSLYAYYADTVLVATEAGHAQTVASVLGAQTTGYALDGHFWKHGGNLGTDNYVLGSTNAEKLKFYTNNQERFHLTADGKFHRRINDSIASLYWVAKDALRFFGELDSGNYYTPPPGQHFYWNPHKVSLHIGTVADTMWTEANTGKYTLTAGRYCFSRSNYAVAIGDSCRIFPIPANGNLSTGTAGFCIGYQCEVNGQYSIATGYQSKAKVARSAAMGYQCEVDDGFAHIAMGYKARVDGNIVCGWALGYNVFVKGRYTTVFGSNAATNDQQGTFVWGDASTSNIVMPPTAADNQFVARATGGFYFFSDTAATMGVAVSAGGGAWTSVSDRKKKENIKQLPNGYAIDRIKGLDLYEWNYNSQDSATRHMGPVAQAFYRQFGLGGDATRITTTDADGVTLLALKEIDQRVLLLEAAVEKTEQLPESTATTSSVEFNTLEQRLDALEQRIEASKASLNEE